MRHAANAQLGRPAADRVAASLGWSTEHDDSRRSRSESCPGQGRDGAGGGGNVGTRAAQGAATRPRERGARWPAFRVHGCRGPVLSQEEEALVSLGLFLFSVSNFIGLCSLLRPFFFLVRV